MSLPDAGVPEEIKNVFGNVTLDRGGPISPPLLCDKTALMDLFRSLQFALNRYYSITSQDEFCRSEFLKLHLK